MGTYFQPYNHTKKQRIDWHNKTKYNNKNWICDPQSRFLVWLMQEYWFDCHVELMRDDFWEEFKNYTDVTENAIESYNLYNRIHNSEQFNINKTLTQQSSDSGRIN
mgnify:CR=1 FL=1